jgi:hypothetical protein
MEHRQALGRAAGSGCLHQFYRVEPIFTPQDQAGGDKKSGIVVNGHHAAVASLWMELCEGRACAFG